MEYVQANVEALLFPDNTFDCITISLACVTSPIKKAALNVSRAEAGRTSAGA